MDFSDDAEVFLAEFGVPCRCAGVDFLGILDTPDDVLGVGGIAAQSAMRTLTVKSAVVDSAQLKEKAQIEIDVNQSGVFVTFVVRGPARRVDDGLFSTLNLNK